QRIGRIATKKLDTLALENFADRIDDLHVASLQIGRSSGSTPRILFWLTTSRQANQRRLRQRVLRSLFLDLRDHFGAEALNGFEKKLGIHAGKVDHEPHHLGFEL